jgi:hypothetical protein
MSRFWLDLMELKHFVGCDFDSLDHPGAVINFSLICIESLVCCTPSGAGSGKGLIGLYVFVLGWVIFLLSY